MLQGPPILLRHSNASTRLSVGAKYAAQARPLCPAPTITTSQRREANSRTGAGNPISPRRAAVGEFTGLVSTLELQVGKQTVTMQISTMSVFQTPRVRSCARCALAEMNRPGRWPRPIRFDTVMHLGTHLTKSNRHSKSCRLDRPRMCYPPPTSRPIAHDYSKRRGAFPCAKYLS